MKKYLFVLWLVITNLLILKADPLYLDSICIVQPNGDTLWSRLQGDEFYHWRSTIDGHVIMRDSINYFRYAQIVGDTILQPCAIIARNVEDRTPLERGYLNLHSDNIKEFICSEILKTRMIEESDTTQMSHVQCVASNGQQPVTGTRKVLTILVEFEDRQFSRDKVEFDSLMNQQSGAVGLNYGSVRQYYQENSYGQLTIESTVIGPIEVEGSYTSYQRKIGEKSTKVKKLVRRAISQAIDMVDFSTLDGDNDGYVDCVHVVYAGTRYMNSSTDIFIWPHHGHVNWDGTSARDYIITPELNMGGAIAPMGTICHELGHILGAPDFYDRKHEWHPMGRYDIMDSGNENGINIYGDIDQYPGYCPAHHNPYTKSYIFKWDTPIPIDSTNRTYVLASSTKSKGHIYRIDTQTPGEYFLLENRTAESFDSYIPNSGLLVYHVHPDLEACINNGDSINSNHPLKLYLVNAESSDAAGELGNAFSYRAYPGRNHDKTMFTSTSTPNANAWDGGKTGVDICLINKLDNGNISFTVNPKIEGPSQLCGMQYYDIYGHIPSTDTILWGYVADFDCSQYFPGLRFPGGKQGNPITIERGYQLGMLIDWDTMPQYPSIPMRSVSTATNSMYGQLPYVGEVLLYATITSENGSHIIEKKVVLPAYIQPEINLSYTRLIYVNQETTLTESKCDNIDEQYIKWYVRYPNTETDIVYSGRSITITPTETGPLTIRVVNDCSCAQRSENTYNLTVIGQLPSIMSYPNPVMAPTLPIKINFEGNTTTSSRSTIISHTIELWSEQLGLVRSARVDGSHVYLDVSGLPNGWYQILLMEGNNIVESNLVHINI